jgi:hypothetical protein
MTGKGSRVGEEPYYLTARKPATTAFYRMLKDDVNGFSSTMDISFIMVNKQLNIERECISSQEEKSKAKASPQIERESSKISLVGSVCGDVRYVCIG